MSRVTAPRLRPLFMGVPVSLFLFPFMNFFFLSGTFGIYPGIRGCATLVASLCVLLTWRLRVLFSVEKGRA